MAYKQKPGRGKSNPFKAMEKYTSSPIKLENGEGDDKKTKTKENKTDFDVLGHLSAEARKGPGMRYDVVPASKPPIKPGVGKTSLSTSSGKGGRGSSGGGTPKSPKTKVKSTQGAPYGFNLSNRQLKKEMKEYGKKWKGRGDALATLSGIKKPTEKIGSQYQITKTRTTIDPFTFK